MQQVNELNLFIQKNLNFYEEKFRKMDDSGKSISWNWAAFFMGIYWMIYRKMYFKAGAFFILSLVASSTPYIGGILNLAVLIGIGIYANALYQDQIRGNMEKTKGLLPEAKEIIAKKRGGTNLPLAIVLYAVHNIVVIAILVMVSKI
ncbi:MAG: DUF2628 domain-containing protein [Terrisporobacter othiniensis]|uniref:DUF2628 domain-containing protein n=1 Tax=Terrisporobacter petrolearius TaxID=1460447 RepID=UPI0022DFA247|nr:DUF2628 domain-containing protein [Terrisporobacter petrolearius]MDU4859882.1 DUF2628 domain-containing protein [Terrisporobacter othiniensis]MDU6996464.1 DUF2628 domain-containing protein [Terrisporobacter othiniensis]